MLSCSISRSICVPSSLRRASPLQRAIRWKSTSAPTRTIPTLPVVEMPTSASSKSNAQGTRKIIILKTYSRTLISSFSFGPLTDVPRRFLAGWELDSDHFIFLIASLEEKILSGKSGEQKMRAFIAITPGLEKLLAHDINLKIKVPAKELKTEKGNQQLFVPFLYRSNLIGKKFRWNWVGTHYWTTMALRLNNTNSWGNLRKFFLKPKKKIKSKNKLTMAHYQFLLLTCKKLASVLNFLFLFIFRVFEFVWHLQRDQSIASGNSKSG